MVKKMTKTGFFDMTIDEYHAADGVSRSMLYDFSRKTPEHFLYSKKKTTKSMSVGSAIDLCISDYDTFLKYYGRLPCDYDGRTKYGKSIYEELEARGLKPLTDEVYEACLRIRDNLLKNKIFQIISRNGEYQKSAFFYNHDIDITFKARPDLYSNEMNMIIDLKSSSQGADIRTFEKSVFSYWYHVQAAMYLDVIDGITGNKNYFGFVVYEPEPPYAVAFYELSREYIDVGRKTYIETALELKNCLDTGVWDSYPQEFVTINPPSWMI